MKRILSSLALSILSCFVYGQVVITDSAHCPYYTLDAFVSGGLIPISSGITADDNWSAVIPIGFTYNFYGTPYTQCIIGSNGCLGFDIANALAYNTWPITNTLALTTAPDIVNCICVPWCDVYIPAGGTIMYSTVGTAPNRKFEVTWCGTAMFSCTTQWLTTQVIIYESSGLAEVHIGHHTYCTSWNGGYAIVGVKNATGTVSTVAPGRDYPANWLATDEAWRFTPIAGPSYSVTPIPYNPIPYAASSIYWFDSTTGAFIDSGATIVVSPSVTTTYEAAAFGCLDTTKAFIRLAPPACITAVNNSPCVFDTLKLFAIGDSTGATYLWHGPDGFTSALKDPFIFPASAINSGNYTVVRTIGGVVDSSTTLVVIHPTPVVNVASNVPLCGAMPDSLQLSATPDSAGETFSWSGPNGFASTSEFPVVYPFDSSDAGNYFVNVISPYGCPGSGSVFVYPGIAPGFTFTRHFGCFFDTVYFTNTTTNASTYSWNFGDGTPTDPNRNTYHVYSSNSVFYVTLHCTNAHCDSSITIPVDLRHTVTALFTPEPDTICVGQSITFADASFSTLGYTFPALFGDSWRFGDGATDNTFSPTHTYSAPGVYPVTLSVTDSIGCEDSLTKNVYVLLLSLSSFNDTTLCISQPLPLTNVLSVEPDITLNYNFQWGPGTAVSDSTVQVPTFYGLGTYVLTLTASVNPYGCAITDVITINSVLGKVLSNLTPTTTITLGTSVQLNADSEVIYWWKPNDGSLNNSNINTPIATPTQSTLYTVYGYDANGCLDSGYVDIIVDSTLEDGIPSGFTPNNDGLNDVFKPVGMKFQQLVDFRIYNRWGQQLFYSTNPNDGWDGTFNGVPQDIGVYFYSITVAKPGGSGENIVYKGEITLIR